jgi:hypothetical protein
MPRDCKTITEICNMPLYFGTEDSYSRVTYHESYLRSNCILNKVKELLKSGISNILLLEIIESMEQISRTNGKLDDKMIFIIPRQKGNATYGGVE